jgi:hypothetical protein
MIPLPPFIKYGSIEEVTRLRVLRDLFEKEVEVFEKLDGGNCQVRKINGRLYAGSKANFLIGPVVGKTEWFGRLNGWMYSNSTLYQLPEHIIMFGEWGGHHTIHYDKDAIDKFHVIDVLDLNQRTFMEYEKGKALLQNCGIEDVRFFNPLAKGRVNQRILEELLRQPSANYSGTKEGIIVKDYQSRPQKFVKILNPGFEEKRERLWGKIDHFTEARVRKNIQAAIELHGTEGLTLDKLYAYMREDIMKEGGGEYDLDYIRRKVRPHLDILFAKEGVEVPEY